MKIGIGIFLFYVLGALIPSMAQESVFVYGNDQSKSRSDRFGRLKLAVSHYKQGLELRNQNKLTEAAESFDSAIYLKPDYLDAYFERAGIMENLHRHQEALKDYEIIFHLDSTYKEALFGKARVLYQMERYEEAVIHFEKLAAGSDSPTNSVYFKVPVQGGNQAGVTEISTLNSQKKDVLNYLAMTWYRLGEIEKAVSILDEGIERYPAQTDLYLNRGLVFFETGQNQNARADFDQVLKLSPGHPKALYNIALLESGNVESSSASFSEGYPEIKIMLPAAYYNRSVNRFNTGKYKLAAADLDTAISMDSADPAFYNARAMTRIKLKMNEEAMSDLSQVLKMDPENLQAKKLRGDVFFKIKEFDLAASDYSEVLEKERNDPYLYFNRSMCLFQLQKVDEACADLQISEELGYQAAGMILDKYCGKNKE